MGFGRVVWTTLVCLLLSGCATSQQFKIVTDITPDGKVTYHTEFVAEF